MFYVKYHGWEAWKRAGHSYKTFYDSQATTKRQLASLLIERARELNIERIEGNLGFCAVFCKKFPKSFSNKKRNGLKWWATKPDIDNLSKFIFDTLEKQADLIDNDSNIVANLTLKIWGQYDYTAFILGEFTDDSYFVQRNSCVGFGGIIFNYDNGVFVEKEK
jgi:Holliday junction resolvase RusA-like endonuclease